MSDEYRVNESRLNPDLRELEVELSRIELPGSRVDRDSVLFESGRAAGLVEIGQTDPQPVWPTGRVTPRGFWPTASVVSAAVAVLIGVLLYQEIRNVSRLNIQLARAEQSRIQDKSDSEAPAMAGDAWHSDRLNTQAPNDNLPAASLQPGVDLVQRVRDWPRGQVMTAGLMLSGRRSPVGLKPDLFQNEPEDLERVRLRKNHREMINELLSEFETFGA